jgi:hypothetical protein
VKNYRKLLLGLVYLLGLLAIAALQILKYAPDHPADFTGLGVFAGGLAAGVGTLVWGYNHEHDTEAKKAPPAP